MFVRDCPSHWISHEVTAAMLVSPNNEMAAMLVSVTSSNVLRKGSLQTKLNAGLSEQQQEDLFQK